jgi:hypothetical protein
MEEWKLIFTPASGSTIAFAHRRAREDRREKYRINSACPPLGKVSPSADFAVSAVKKNVETGPDGNQNEN